MDPYASGLGPGLGSCEHVNENSVAKKGGKLFDQPRGYCLFTKESVTLS